MPQISRVFLCLVAPLAARGLRQEWVKLIRQRRVQPQSKCSYIYGRKSLPGTKVHPLCSRVFSLILILLRQPQNAASRNAWSFSSIFLVGKYRYQLLTQDRRVVYRGQRDPFGLKVTKSFLVMFLLHISEIYASINVHTLLLSLAITFDKLVYIIFFQL